MEIKKQRSKYSKFERKLSDIQEFLGVGICSISNIFLNPYGGGGGFDWMYFYTTRIPKCQLPEAKAFYYRCSFQDMPLLRTSSP